MTRTTRCTTHHGQRVDSQVLEAQFVEMTPGLAEWLLGMNTHNRKVKPSVVDKYAKRMTDGEFVATNQGIGIVACCAHARRQSIASLFAATGWSLPQRRLTPCGSQ